MNKKRPCRSVAKPFTFETAVIIPEVVDIPIWIDEAIAIIREHQAQWGRNK